MDEKAILAQPQVHMIIPEATSRIHGKNQTEDPADKKGIRGVP